MSPGLPLAPAGRAPPSGALRVSDAKAPGERVEIAASDGGRVVAHRFHARSPCARVVIGAALGVRQDFYFDFARHLAERGLSSCTFDYRGVGHGAPRSLRGHPATLAHWVLDYDAVLASAARPGERLPLFVVGHSLGAQLPAITASSGKIAGMVAVAGGGGYWRGLSPRARPFMLAMLNVAAPVSIPIAGYFPGAKLGMIGDLPGGVMRQWRRWCLDPEYLVGAEPGAREAYARARFPILSLAIADDWMMPERNIESLHVHFGTRSREARRITRAIAGGPVGHTGFFRRRYRETLWPIASDWLLERARAAGRERSQATSPTVAARPRANSTSAKYNESQGDAK